MNEASENLPGYQARDYEVVDYELYRLAGTDLKFRGPEPQLQLTKLLAAKEAAGSRPAWWLEFGRITQ